MSDPNDVSAEATMGVLIEIAGTRLWKVVAVVGSGDDRWLVLWFCSGVPHCCFVTDCTGDC